MRELNIFMILIFVIIFVAEFVVNLPTSIIKYEEYEIEHQISASVARNAVSIIDVDSVIPKPGCQKCTPSEVNYCLGRGLIDDHCCCDKRYHEELSFVPHTCYRGTQLCKPVIGDCIYYTRLRECCCDQLVLQKWKEKSSSNRQALIWNCLLVVSFFFVYIYSN